MLTLFLSGLGSDSIHTLCISFAFSFRAKARCSARYGSCYTSESMFLGNDFTHRNSAV